MTMSRWKQRVACAAAALAVMAPAGATTYQVLHSFDGKHGQHPVGALALDPATGDLYGTTLDGGKWNNGVLFRRSAAGFQVIHHFRGGTTDGAHPMGSLVLDGSGRVYGSTYDGGPSNAGTFFSFDASGTYRVLASLDGADQGREVVAGVAIGGDGSLYGAASEGGAMGYGTILRIDPATGGITVIHAFDPEQYNEGAWPESTPVWVAGTVYGTTYGGSFYAVAADGSTFQSPAYSYLQNWVIYAGLARDATGAWWGVAMGGDGGTGDLWHIAVDGTFSLDYDFPYDPGPQGINPTGTPVFGNDARLYGTTRREGDAQCSCGTVYSYDPASAQEKTLHQFKGRDGNEPWAGLVTDGLGTFYGVTEYGGKRGGGVMFRIVP